MKKQLPLTIILLVVAAFVVHRFGGQSSRSSRPAASAAKAASAADSARVQSDAATPLVSLKTGDVAPAAIASTAARPALSRDELLAAYPDVPRDAIVGTTPLQQELLAELKLRYRAQLDGLRRQIASSGAKMVVVFLTPEFESDTQKSLEPFIRTTCAEMGIEYADLTPRLRGLDPLTYTQMPRDGHWSARGASLVAGVLGSLLDRHFASRAPQPSTHDARPALLGDLDPGQDVILDGGKSLPYRLITNNQGLRLDHDLAFPKTKQRVLLLGDSQIYCPFLDNRDTIPAQLQRIRPVSEIVSAANLGYGVDDFESLFRERARFIEPDLVIVQTGGGDILDTYFAHRNLFSRTKRAYEPDPVEARFQESVMRTAGR